MSTSLNERPGPSVRSQARSIFSSAAKSFAGLTIYERFEQAVILVLTALIVLIVASATWHLGAIVAVLVLSDGVQPANQAVFQTVFGMIFTVIIALEFKRSLLIVLERQESVVRVRSIVLIAMLAMVRKFIILDISTTGDTELFGLSAAILSLGVVHWLVRDQDQRAPRPILGRAAGEREARQPACTGPGNLCLAVARPGVETG